MTMDAVRFGSVARSRRFSILSSVISAIGATALVGLFADRASATPSLVAVTPIDGLNVIVGAALSADGSTVVGSRPRQDRTTLVTHNRAFLWTRDDGFRLFDELEDGAPSPSTFQPRDVSGDGSRVVGSLDGQPVVWERGGATTSLDLPPGGTSGGAAYAISDNGRHVVGRAHDGGTVSRAVVTPGGGVVVVEEPRHVPVVWNVEDGTAIALSTVPGTVLDVSNDGVAVGSFDLSYLLGGTVGFRWDESRGVQRVPSGDLDSSLKDAYSAAGISGDGTTVVGHAYGPPPPGSTFQNGAIRAYRWNGDAGSGDVLPAEGLTLLDSPPSLIGISRAEAMGTSADGSTIVGGFLRDGDFSNTLRPFVWTQENGFQDLEVLLQTLGVSTAGWTLSSAIDVSADGKTILGTGRFRNELGRTSDALWIAVIPEPTTACLLALGLVGLSTRRGPARPRPVIRSRPSHGRARRSPAPPDRSAARARRGPAARARSV